MIGLLSIDPAGRGPSTVEPVQGIGNQGFAQASALASNRYGEPLKVSLTLGLTGNGVGVKGAVTDRPHPGSRGGIDCLRYPVVVELPERFERLGIKVNDGSPVAGVGPANPKVSVRPVGEGTAEVPGQKMKRFSLGESGRVEPLAFRRADGAGDDGLKSLLLEVVQGLLEGFDREGRGAA